MCICIITVNERWRLDQSFYTREEPYEVAVFLFKHVYIQLTRPEMHLGLPTNAFLQCSLSETNVQKTTHR